MQGVAQGLAVYQNDMLASYWDMLDGNDAALRQGLNCTIPFDFRALPREEKADFMVDILAPWYVGYYATWFDYVVRNPGRACILHYADFLRNPAGMLESLLRHAGISCTLAACQEAIEATWQERHAHRFNHGIEGRGRRYFTDQHRERLARMLSYYPATDGMRAELIGG